VETGGSGGNLPVANAHPRWAAANDADKVEDGVFHGFNRIKRFLAETIIYWLFCLLFS
jgi:hypothetical protein